MLLVAGMIEGFFSPTDAPVAMKFALGGLLLAALAAYLFGSCAETYSRLRSLISRY